MTCFILITARCSDSVTLERWLRMLAAAGDAVGFCCSVLLGFFVVDRIRVRVIVLPRHDYSKCWRQAVTQGGYCCSVLLGSFVVEGECVEYVFSSWSHVSCIVRWGGELLALLSLQFISVVL